MYSQISPYIPTSDELPPWNSQITNDTLYRLAGLRVVGNTYLDEKAILSVFELKVGDQLHIPGNKLQQAIRKLWALDVLDNARVIISKRIEDYVFLDIIIQEQPRIARLKFDEANSEVRKRDRLDLADELQPMVGKALTSGRIEKIKASSKQFFYDLGYPNATIEIRQEKDKVVENGCIAILEIHSGERVKIEEVIVKGNKQLTEGKIRRMLFETKSVKWYNAFTPSILLKPKLLNDLEAVKTSYHSLGYRDVEIKHQIVDGSKPTRLKIELEINEGEPYYFGNIEWYGNDLFSSDTLVAILNIKRGDIYNASLLSQKLNFDPSGNDISSLYLDRGYLFAQVNPKETDLRGDTVDLQIQIFEGSTATFGKIIIQGNTTTRDAVIRRELYTIPGQTFSRAALIRSQQALARLGYFKVETMEATPIPHPEEGVVDIVYKLEEKLSQKFTLAGAWSANQGVIGTIGLEYNNFALRNLFKLREYRPLPSGDGQRLSLQAQATGPNYQNFGFSFVEPWLGGHKPNELSVGINQSVLRQNISDSIPGNLRIFGANVQLAQRLTRYHSGLQWINKLSFNRYVLNGSSTIPIIENGTEYELDNTTFNNLRFSSALTRNSTDQPVFPRKGSILNLEMAVTPPYSLFSNSTPTDLKDKYRWLEYHKWRLDFETYHPISFRSLFKGKTKSGQSSSAKLLAAGKIKQDKWIWYNKVGTGFIGNYNKSRSPGPFERFIMGGTNNFGLNNAAVLLGQEYVALRGYENNSLLLNQFPGNDPTQSPIGGIAFMKYSSEVRRLFFNSQVGSMYGLAFFEAGNNFHSYNEIDPLKWRASAGVGLRLFLPMLGGTLGLDYGRPLDGSSTKWLPQITIGN